MADAFGGFRIDFTEGFCLETFPASGGPHEKWRMLGLSTGQHFAMKLSHFAPHQSNPIKMWRLTGKGSQ